MNYDEAIAYIHDTLKFGSKLGLHNIGFLLKLMGDPQKKLKFVHVAGTNGKQRLYNGFHKQHTYGRRLQDGHIYFALYTAFY